MGASSQDLPGTDEPSFDDLGLSRAHRNAPSPRATPQHASTAPPKQSQPQSLPRELHVARIPVWSQFPWLRHGFSTRIGGQTTAYKPDEPTGDLNLGFTASDSRENVLANRKLLLSAITGNPATPLVTLRQIHSPMIHRVGKSDAGEEARTEGDGMMTGDPGIMLGIQTADCIPVLIADTRTCAVAAFHAGWRGTVKRIVEHGVGRMRLEFGSRPEDLVAAIGPGIAACCYAIGEEVRAEFESQFAYAAELFFEASDSDPVKEKYPMLFLTARAPGHSNLGPSIHLDLFEANRRQLLDAGIPPKNISVQGDCTSCRTDLYFSHRAEHGFTGRSLSVIGVAAEE